MWGQGKWVIKDNASVPFLYNTSPVSFWHRYFHCWWHLSVLRHSDRQMPPLLKATQSAVRLTQVGRQGRAHLPAFGLGVPKSPHFLAVWEKCNVGKDLHKNTPLSRHSINKVCWIEAFKDFPDRHRSQSHSIFLVYILLTLKVDKVLKY